MTDSGILYLQSGGDYSVDAAGWRWMICGTVVRQVMGSQPLRLRAIVSRRPLKGSVGLMRDEQPCNYVLFRGNWIQVFNAAIDLLDSAGIPLGGRFYLKLEAVE